MRHKWTACLWAIALMGILVVQSCGGSNEYKVGAVLALSGEAGEYGKSSREGIELAVEMINEGGGVKGKPLRIVYRDSGTLPSQGLTGFQELINDEGVPVVIGASTSSTTLAIAPEAVKKKKVLISPSASSPSISEAGPFIFRNYPSDVLEGAMMADFAADKFKLKTVAVLAMQNEYGTGLKTIFVQQLKKRGGEIVKVINFPPLTEDYTEQIQELKKSNPEAVYVIGYYREIAAILKEIQKQEVSVTILSVAALGSDEAIRLAGSAAEGVLFPLPHFDDESSEPHVREFVDRFRARYDKSANNWAAHGYDVVQILAHVFENKGYNGEDIKFGLLSMRDFPGVTGTTKFDQNGDVIKYPRLWVVKSGQFVPVDKIFGEVLD